MATAYRKFYKDVDLRSPDKMKAFLSNHFRYDTASSWNRSTSYANCLKIHSLSIPDSIRNKIYDLYNCDDFYELFEPLITEFNNLHKNQWSVGFNGRSDGYLVLYNANFPFRPVDMYEDFEDFTIDDLKSRVKLVQEFDRLCDDIVATAIYAAENYTAEKEEYYVRKERFVLAPA